jgi:hypothetical protein
MSIIPYKIYKKKKNLTNISLIKKLKILKKKTKKTKKILTKRGETFSTLETTLGKNEVPYKPVFLPIKSFDLIVIVPQKV